jgi:hypothetical protein
MTPMRTAADAEQAVDAMAGLVERLRGVLEEETELVRAGKVRAATALAATKSELAGQLFTGSERLKANAQFVRQSAPASCAALGRAQDAFRAILQRNMMVLATAHAVSEGIVRRLSGDLARKRSPQVYGASGRTTVPNPKHGQPLALSRTL